jgi:hypothetical protein
LPLAFRGLVPHTRSYARSGGRPRPRLIPATIPVTQDLRQGRTCPATWLGTTGLSPSGSCFRSAARMPPRGTDGSARRLCGSDGIAALEGPAACPRPWAARRAAHGGRFVATGLQGGLRTLDDGGGRGGGLGRHRRRIQGGPRGGPERGRGTVGYREDGCFFLRPPLATAPPCAPTLPPGSTTASVVERGGLGGRQGGWGGLRVVDPLSDSAADGSGRDLFLAYGNGRLWRRLVSGNFRELTFRAVWQKVTRHGG